MDTKSHWTIANDAGLPVLKAALERVNKRGWRCEALRLGNWLTDVTQSVDPVAVANGKQRLQNSLNGMFSAIRSVVDEYLPDAVRPDDWRTNLNNRKDEIESCMDFLLRFCKGGQESDWAKAFRKGFRFRGYFKFVHPEEPSSGELAPRARMHFDSYLQVFDNRFTQYWPHEHLDRFPSDLRKSGGYSRDVARGTRTPNGTGTGAAQLTHHMYGYLVDGIHRAAGLLAEVDLEWARTTFSNSSAAWASDEDTGWNEYLAKFGHAMHVIEDFFAHSNFIELALKQHPNQRRLVPEEDEWWFGDSPWEIFTKRLTRCEGPELREMRAPENAGDLKENMTRETNVVTGYFDLRDTFFSLRHIGNDLFGRDMHGEHKNVGPLLRNTIENVKARARQYSGGSSGASFSASRAAAEEVLMDLATQGGDPDVTAAANTVLREVPLVIKESFLDCVAMFCMAVPGEALTLYDVYVELSELAEKLKQPVELLKWLIGEVSGWLQAPAEWLAQQFREPLQRAIDEEIGRFRIGCHSLLAKDYEWNVPELEWVDGLYRYAMHCAKALHWYVMKTMTRWSEPTILALSRAEPVPPDQTSERNLSDTLELIDWHELIESFLRHPHGQPGPPAEERWWAPVISGSWTSLRGYNRTDAERSQNLPHSLVYVNEYQEVQQLASRAAELSAECEGRYVPSS